MMARAYSATPARWASRGHRLETARLALPLRPIEGLAEVQEPGSASGEARGRGGLGTVKKEDRMARILGRTLFPRAEDIPQSLAIAFMRMMMTHAKFESEVRALQGVVANDLSYGEQAQNLWSAKERPKLMVKLIKKN